MNVSDVEKTTGIPRATVRYYESEGLICPERGENGYRLYSEGDVAKLRKIKLLRSVGFTIDDIRRCDEDGAVFHDILRARMEDAERLSGELQNAEAVLSRMLDEGESYEDMDPAQYEAEPYEPSLPQAEIYVPAKRVDPRPGPWRRFFARLIDYSLIQLVGMAIPFFLLRSTYLVSPTSDQRIWSRALLGLITIAGMLIFEPLCLSFFGATPGKWMLGISVSDARGEKLGYRDAVWRTTYILFYIECLFIPVINLIGRVRAFLRERRGEGQETDDISLIREEEYYVWKGAALVVSLALMVFLFVYMAAASPEPPTTGLMTVPELAENYDFYNDSTLYELNRELSWKSPGNFFFYDVSGYEPPEVSVELMSNVFVKRVTMRYEGAVAFAALDSLSYARTMTRAVYMAEQNAFFDPFPLMDLLSRFDKNESFAFEHGGVVYELSFQSSAEYVYTISIHTETEG